MRPKQQRFTLFGAKRFARYLERQVEGGLVASEPELISGSSVYGGQKWIIRAQATGEIIGEYLVFFHDAQHRRFMRQYCGRIPGHINQSIVRGNKGRPVGQKKPVDRVILVFDQMLHPPHSAPGERERWGHDTPPDPRYRRRDGNKTIPFP